MFAAKETSKLTPVPTHLILARGMDDLPAIFSGIYAFFEGAEFFDSNWKNKKETFVQKLKRFENMVLKAKSQNKRVVVIGVSAGAGLALALMLEKPELIDFLYSCSGVLDPNLNEQKTELEKLLKKSDSFSEMCEFITHRLHSAKSASGVPELIKRNNLQEKIMAFSSEGESDHAVPHATRLPSWGEELQYVGINGHRRAIAKTLLFDINRELKRQGKVKFIPV